MEQAEEIERKARDRRLDLRRRDVVEDDEAQHAPPRLLVALHRREQLLPCARSIGGGQTERGQDVAVRFEPGKPTTPAESAETSPFRFSTIICTYC